MWSSKLHDFLQPKRHILMEPEPAYFEPFIKPLLDTPVSTYVHTTLSGAHPKSYWNSYDKLVEDGTLQLVAPTSSKPESRPGSPNHDVLVIGSLARQYRLHKVPHSVIWQRLVLKQLINAASTSELFHQAGPVRMLLWMPESDKTHLFPYSIRTRTAANVGMAMFGSVTEAVGTSPLKGLLSAIASARSRDKESPNRFAGIAGASAKRVAARMRDSGIEVPQLGRKLQAAELSAQDKMDMRFPLDDLSSTYHDLLSHLASAEIRFHQIHQMVARFGGGPKAKEDMRRMAATLEFPQSLAAAHATLFAKLGNAAEKLAVVVDVQLRIIKVEASFRQVEESAIKQDGMADVKLRILKLGEALDAMVGLRLEPLGKTVTSIVEEYMAYAVQPPILSYDRRRYEPIQAEMREFWPKADLMLLDVTPAVRDLAVPEVAEQREGVKVCQELIKHLFSRQASSLPEALDRIAPNGAQDLIPLVPALTDPRRGGRLDAKKLRVRMLTDEMMDGLTKAFLEWPFRPSTVQLELEGTGSEAGSEDVEDAAEVVNDEK